MEKASQDEVVAGVDSVMFEIVGSVYWVVVDVDVFVLVAVFALWLVEELVEALEMDGCNEVEY